MPDDQASHDNDADGASSCCVEFRPESAKAFKRLLTEPEQRASLLYLIDDVDSAIALEQGEGVPLKLLKCFNLNFYFFDLRDVGRLLVYDIKIDNGDPPKPPRDKGLRDAVRNAFISGTIGAAIREAASWLFLRGGASIGLDANNAWARNNSNSIKYNRKSGVYVGGKVSMTSLILKRLSEMHLPSTSTLIGTNRSVKPAVKPDPCPVSSNVRRLISTEQNRLAITGERFDTKEGLVKSDAFLGGRARSWLIKKPESTLIANPRSPNSDQAEVNDSVVHSMISNKSEGVRSPTLGAVRKKVDANESVTVPRVPISRSVNVREIRERQGMTQEQFADCFGLSVASLRNWEQGTRTPERPVALYLRLIDRFPEQVRREVEALRQNA